MTKRLRYIALGASIFAASACGGAEVPIGPAGPPEVVVSPNPAVMVAGGTLRLVAELSGDSAGQSVTWTTHHPAVATVDAKTGVVTGVSPGYAAITATAYSGATGSAAVSVGVAN